MADHIPENVSNTGEAQHLGTEQIAFQDVNVAFFGEFAKKSCKNAPISFAMPVFPSTCNMSRTAGRIFMKFDIGEF
jgi:hypothetical protein